MAGALADRGYGLLFAIDALTCLACAAIVWRFVPPDTAPAVELTEPGRLRGVVADRVMVAFCAVVGLLAIVYMQSFSTLPLAMREDGLSPGAYGVTIALNGVLIVVLQPLLLGLVNDMRRRDALAAGSVLIAAGMGIEGLAANLAAYALPVAMWTTGEILLTSVAPATIADMAPAHLRGRYQAVYGTAFSGAYVIAPLAGAALLDAVGGGRCGAPAPRSASPRRRASWRWRRSSRGGPVAPSSRRPRPSGSPAGRPGCRPCTTRAPARSRSAGGRRWRRRCARRSRSADRSRPGRPS
jgi:MFS transporter